MTPGARIAATIELLDRILVGRVPMDLITGDYFRGRKYIGSKDRREIAERVYRIIRHYARYEWHLNNKGFEKNGRNFVLLDCHFNDVDPVNRFFKSSGKYVPDTLSDQEEAIFTIDTDITTDEMPVNVKFEIPEWAYERMQNRFGDAFEIEAKAMLSEAELDIRVNTILSSKADAMQSLKNDGVDVIESSYASNGLRLKEKTYLAKTKAFQKGWVEIQDEGSQLIAELCDVKPGMRVLDYCAGGGGKTLALAAMMENKGSVVATDIDKRRLENGRKRYRKAGVHNVELKTLKDEQTKKWFKRQKETFDVVLIDAPCSSSGTWRRNPDLRWHNYGPSLEEIKVFQHDILRRVAKCVKKDGVLVYATCSVFKEENEEQVHSFIKEYPEFQIRKIEKHDLTTEEGFMFLSPGKHHTDGFFTAVLEKV